MPDLTVEHQTFIVQRLACFRTPSEVALDVEEEFGFKIDRTHVRNYNPLQTSTAVKKWGPLFEATRKAYLESAADEAVTHLMHRLRVRGQMLRMALHKKNLPLANELLNDVARELGGCFTNRREVTGKDGSPLAAGVLVLPESVSKEEWAKAAEKSQATLPGSGATAEPEK